MIIETNIKYILKINIINKSMIDYYKSACSPSEQSFNACTINGNAGYDIYLDNDIIVNSNKTFTQLTSGIKCEMIKTFDQITFDNNSNNFVIKDIISKSINVSYLLMPRSSITNYNLIMGNSIGLIDASYRGEILSRVYNLNENEVILKKGQRLFQLVAPNLADFDVEIINSTDVLSSSLRNEGNYGSTGI
jgi:dUTP pyrophosphatase